MSANLCRPTESSKSRVSGVQIGFTCSVVLDGAASSQCNFLAALFSVFGVHFQIHMSWPRGDRPFSDGPWTARTLDCLVTKREFQDLQRQWIGCLKSAFF